MVVNGSRDPINKAVSPGILGFEMGTNNMKLKISGSVQNVLLLPVKNPKVSPERNILFLPKFRMAAKRHVEVEFR